MARKFFSAFFAYGHCAFSEIKQVCGFLSIKLALAENAELKLHISKPYMSFYRYIDKKGRFGTKNSQEKQKKPIIVLKITIKSGKLPNSSHLSMIREASWSCKCPGR